MTKSPWKFPRRLSHFIIEPDLAAITKKSFFLLKSCSSRLVRSFFFRRAKMKGEEISAPTKDSLQILLLFFLYLLPVASHFFCGTLFSLTQQTQSNNKKNAPRQRTNKSPGRITKKILSARFLDPKNIFSLRFGIVSCCFMLSSEGRAFGTRGALLS